MTEFSKQILIVEDDKGTAELFSEMLNVGGYQVRVCFDSKQAISALETSRPDAIILDMMMPVSSGMDLLKFVREHADFSTIPVVVVSAQGLPTEIERAEKAGASAYLTKPVSFLDIKEALEKVLL